MIESKSLPDNSLHAAKNPAGFPHYGREQVLMSEQRKVLLHFPIERVTEHVVTRLVTDYDLSPNILRADVNAQTGGWPEVELTGNAARTEDALAWLRAQGLVVSDPA